VEQNVLSVEIPLHDIPRNITSPALVKNASCNTLHNPQFRNQTTSERRAELEQELLSHETPFLNNKSQQKNMKSLTKKKKKK
jgi:hypothetical protein